MRYATILILTLVWFITFMGVLSHPAGAISVEKTLSDPLLEARAVKIHKALRCLVCQNQSIHDSNATLARDLRSAVRDRLAAGEDDKQVIQFIVTRYGDWVLLNPPFKASTLLLWLGPAVLLVIASITVIIYFRRRGIKNTEVPLTAEEKRRLNTLLEDES